MFPILRVLKNKLEPPVKFHNGSSGDSTKRSPRADNEKEVKRANNEKEVVQVGRKVGRVNKMVPLHVDTKVKLVKRSANSGPPLNKEVKALLDERCPELVYQWMPPNTGFRLPDSFVTEEDKREAAKRETRSLRKECEKRHSSVLSSSDDPYLKEIDTSQLKKTYPCPVKECGKEFTGAAMMSHLIIKHDQQFSCHLCFKCFDKNTEMEKHMEVAHDEIVRRPQAASRSTGAVGNKKKKSSAASKHR